MARRPLLTSTSVRLVIVDLSELTRRWQQSWPQCPPIAYLFKSRLHDNWVRFHCRPGSQRYATSEAEYEIILHRHDTILRELDTTEVYVMTAEYNVDDLAAGAEPIHAGLHPNASRWMRAADPDDPEMAYDIHVSQRRYDPGEFDQLLRYVADDHARHVFITDTALRWLYHPYDGGADVILRSSTERNQLKARYSEWLSARQDGL